MNGISGTGSRGSVRQHPQCIAVFLFWQAMLNLSSGSPSLRERAYWIRPLSLEAQEGAVERSELGLSGCC